MDKATAIGLVLGLGGIFAGNLLEGGHTGSLLQFTAGLIVLSGTLGAVMVSNPWQDLRLGLKLLKKAFSDHQDVPVQKVIREIVDCTRIVKKESVIALEGHFSRIQNKFFKKILRNVVDGIDPEIIRDIFETEIEAEEEKLLSGARIWSDAGGYSPTIGIIGAVLGLIHVMGNLTDTSKLGAGIAVAFVATVYGVGFANLVFLPIGSKIKKRIQENTRERRLILEGALLVNSGLSSAVVDQRLRAHLAES
ncbi:MAG: flagellar motor protein [Bdellovibrionota bacterium]